MSFMHQIGAQISSRASIFPQQQSGNGTINGVSIDRMPTGSQQGFLSAELVAMTGPTFTGAGPLVDFKLQDSADDSTFADIATGAPGGPIAAAQISAANQILRVDVDLSKLRQFVRIVAVVSGTTTLVDLAGVLVLGGVLNPPVD
ncbi:hypothetical protein LCGC14_2104530 [marine sediment metagenome]|uniref:Uncharacterized protein n=1 Tax=marine sediment metagenome TaxID=412755 RepID=A0A0F9E945_9ZZZZ